MASTCAVTFRVLLPGRLVPLMIPITESFYAQASAASIKLGERTTDLARRGAGAAARRRMTWPQRGTKGARLGFRILTPVSCFLNFNR